VEHLEDGSLENESLKKDVTFTQDEDPSENVT